MGEKILQRGRGYAGIITFFFFRFSTYFKEENLWNIFQRWRRVWSVFLANRRDKTGNRYGFVRFMGVQDAKAIEKQLDICIGNVKMNVNLPKYYKAKVFYKGK